MPVHVYQIMAAFYELIEPREDVKNGIDDMSVYAASLSDLLQRSEAGRRYWDGREFQKLTYKTDGLQEALEDIRLRLHDGRGNGFRQIETSFGGGKTHSMIAMYHMCKEWDALPVVIDGTTLDPATETVWGEMQKQLDGSITDMERKVAPGGAAIIKLLERKKPVLILIDEISHYLDVSTGVTVGESNVAIQTVNFLQKLFNKVGQMPHVCVVISLPDKDQVLEESYYTQVQMLAGRQRQLITVATDADIPHIIRQRLFKTDEAVVADRSADIIKSYVDTCKAGSSILIGDANEYGERFKDTYPFTPDVIDVLHGRWGSYQKFQRTRGALRLLSSVVHSLLGSDRPYITLSDIDLSVDSVRKELLSHIGANMEFVINTDITSAQSGAIRQGEAGVRAARAIFMYSFPSDKKGATQADIKRAAFTSIITHSEIGDALSTLRRSLFFLELADDDMFRFTPTENINWIIDRATKSVSDSDASDLEYNLIYEAISKHTGSRFHKVHIWPDDDAQTKIDDIDRLQLLILKNPDKEFCKKTVTTVSVRNGRANQNALVFVMPTTNGALSDSIRKRLAVKSIRHQMGLESEKHVNKRVLDDTYKKAHGGIERGLRERYADIWLPDKDETVKQCRTDNVQPYDDNIPLDDIIWKKLVSQYQIAVKLDSSVLDIYNGDENEIFRRMMRTRGERRPASINVIEAAMAKKIERDINAAGGSGSTLGHSITDASIPSDSGSAPSRIVDTMPSGEVSHVEGIRCTDTVDIEKIWEWKDSIFEAVRKHCTSTMRLVVEQRNENTFDVALDMTGMIPRKIADGIRGSLSDDGKYDEDAGW